MPMLRFQSPSVHGEVRLNFANGDVRGLSPRGVRATRGCRASPRWSISKKNPPRVCCREMRLMFPGMRTNFISCQRLQLTVALLAACTAMTCRSMSGSLTVDPARVASVAANTRRRTRAAADSIPGCDAGIMKALGDPNSENPGNSSGIFCRLGEVCAGGADSEARARLFAGLGMPGLAGAKHAPWPGRAAIFFALARKPRLMRPEARDPGPDLGLHIDRRLGRRNLDRLGGGWRVFSRRAGRRVRGPLAGG